MGITRRRKIQNRGAARGAEEDGQPRTQGKTLTESDLAVSAVLERVAQRHNTAITSVALAYVIQKIPHVMPIVGNRTLEHMKGNIDALSVVLKNDEIQEIEAVNPFDPGFPMNFLFQGDFKEAHLAHSTWANKHGHFDYVENPKPIRFGK